MSQALHALYPDAPIPASTPGHHRSAETGGDFVQIDGVSYAGRHVLVDLWGGEGLDDLDRVEAALRAAAEASGATLLHVHLHHFTPNDGVSGVAVLAESHISVHTWPERGYAALDLFMCGDTRPDLGVRVLERHFNPVRVDVRTQLRGRVD